MKFRQIPQFGNLKKKGNVRREEAAQRSAATKLPGSMKANPKLEGRNAGRGESRQQQQHLPRGEENAGKHEDQTGGDSHFEFKDSEATSFSFEAF